MKRVLAIAFKDIKVRFRDVRFILTVLLLPVVLIFFISSTFSLSEKPFRVKVAIFNEDPNLGKVFVEEVLQGNELKGFIEVVAVNSVDEGRKLVQNESVSSFIRIEKDFSEKVFSGAESKIYVYGNPNEQIKASFIKEITEIFALEVMRYKAVLNGIVGVLVNSTSKSSTLNSSLVSSFFTDLFNNLTQKRNDFLNLYSEVATNRSITSFEYYTVGMGVMYILFATNMFSEAFFEERRYNTLNRLLVSPLSKGKIFLGKVLGIFLMGLIEIVFVISFSYVVYGVKWGNILGLLIVSAVSVFTFSSLSLLLASFSKNENQISTFGPIVALVFGFLGGSMWPLFLFPDFLKKLSMFIPNRWAINAYFMLLYGESTKSILPNLAFLVLLGFVFLGAGLINFSRRGYV